MTELNNPGVEERLLRQQVDNYRETTERQDRELAELRAELENCRESVDIHSWIALVLGNLARAQNGAEFAMSWRLSQMPPDLPVMPALRRRSRGRDILILQVDADGNVHLSFLDETDIQGDTDA